MQPPEDEAPQLEERLPKRQSRYAPLTDEHLASAVEETNVVGDDRSASV